MKFPVFRKAKMSNTFAAAIKKAKYYHNTHHLDPYTMYCPHCGSPLVRTNRMEKMETLCEHVSGQEPTYKHVYKCSKESGCCGQFLMWNAGGEAYSDYDNYPEELRNDCYKLAYDKNHFMYGWGPDAINSIAFNSECSVYAPGKTRWIDLKIFKVFGIIPRINFKYKYDGFGTCKYIKQIDIEYLIQDKEDPIRYIVKPGLIMRVRHAYMIWKYNRKNNKK